MTALANELRALRSFSRSRRELHARAADELERLTAALNARETTILGLLDLKIITEQEVDALGPLCEAMLAAKRPRKGLQS